MSYEVIKAISENSERMASCHCHGRAGLLALPRHTGGGGHFLGTVDVGKGEVKAIAMARECLVQNKGDVIILEFQGMEVEGQDMICGGTCRILVEHLGGS